VVLHGGICLPETETDIRETIGSILGLVSRRRWSILLTACTIALATATVVMFLPNRFTSEATLAVRQQQVSQRYVEPTSTITVADAVKAMTRGVLSRNQLLTVIDEFGLYAKVKNRVTPDALVELMRADVGVDPVDQTIGRPEVFTAFKISFTTDNAHLAQAVTSRLTSLFIEEHLKARGSQAATTTNFLTEQLESAKQKLKEQDGKREAFKMQYLSELPERQPSNFEMLGELRSQLQITLTNLSRAHQQHTALESSLSDVLTRLQSEKAKLLTRFTPRHSDVIKKDQEIEKVTAVIERLRTGHSKPLNAATTDDLSLGTIQSQVEANEMETETLTKEERRLRTEIGHYQNRLNLTPIREQQLAALLRDYDIYAQNVKDLQNRLFQAQQTTSVEEHQEGQQFRLTDPPTLPFKPSSPKRLQLSLGGLGAGLAIGIVLAFLLDSRDRSFHSEKTLTDLFALPLVLSVPRLLTPSEERRIKWKRISEWITASALTITVLAAEFYVFRHG